MGDDTLLGLVRVGRHDLVVGEEESKTDDGQCDVNA